MTTTSVDRIGPYVMLMYCKPSNVTFHYYNSNMTYLEYDLNIYLSLQPKLRISIRTDLKNNKHLLLPIL